MADANTSDKIQRLKKEALSALNELVDAVTESVEHKVGKEWLKSLPITVTGLPSTYGTLEQMLIACYRAGELEAIDIATQKASRTN
jgi:hypothetical protein